MAVCVEVGLDEWIALNNVDSVEVSLWTGGLAGCVAVAIVEKDLAFLTHIYSEMNATNWETSYKPALANAIRRAIPEYKEITICQVMVGDDQRTERADLVKHWLDADVLEPNDARCDATVCAKSPVVRIYKHRGGTMQVEGPPGSGQWGQSLTSEDLARNRGILVQGQGFLSSFGRPAGLQ
mmetsp:Transcript_137196/g.438751  ORF Transcript_137196/g.438751 Transcript_137196/m.438751 type:complete len:181 (+) Transcript_137196:68-610(+)